MWRGGVLATVGTVVVAAAIAASSAHAAKTPPSPQLWMADMCTSLKSLEYDSAAAGRIKLTNPAVARKQLLAQLLLVTGDAKTLVSTTSRALPGTPQGATIATLLHRGAVAFQAALVAGQAALNRASDAQLGPQATALAARLNRQSVVLGTTFIHLGQHYPSSQLDATINQTPACALVHG
jgi:hypothetical protein